MNRRLHNRIRFVASLVCGFALTCLITAPRDRALGQSTPSPTPTPSLYGITAIGTFTHTLKGAVSTTGFAVAVTDNSNGTSSLNFYFLCIPGENFGPFGKCPQNGVFVESQLICSAASCSTPTP